MGVVYEVHDRDRGQRVALKALRHPDADQIYRLKREFRVLADLSDPHLVNLYELFVEEYVCYFTMELIEGAPFLEYCGLAGGADTGGSGLALPAVPGSHATRLGCARSCRSSRKGCTRCTRPARCTET